MACFCCTLHFKELHRICSICCFHTLNIAILLWELSVIEQHGTYEKTCLGLLSVCCKMLGDFCVEESFLSFSGPGLCYHVHPSHHRGSFADPLIYPQLPACGGLGDMSSWFGWHCAGGKLPFTKLIIHTDFCLLRAVQKVLLEQRCYPKVSCSPQKLMIHSCLS